MRRRRKLFLLFWCYSSENVVICEKMSKKIRISSKMSRNPDFCPKSHQNPDFPIHSCEWSSDIWSFLVSDLLLCSLWACGSPKMPNMHHNASNYAKNCFESLFLLPNDLIFNSKTWEISRNFINFLQFLQIWETGVR